MAKLTARFDLEDRVSKKLRRIQKGFKDLEKDEKTQPPVRNENKNENSRKNIEKT